MEFIKYFLLLHSFTEFFLKNYEVETHAIFALNDRTLKFYRLLHSPWTQFFRQIRPNEFPAFRHFQLVRQSDVPFSINNGGITPGNFPSNRESVAFSEINNEPHINDKHNTVTVARTLFQVIGEKTDANVQVWTTGLWNG